MDYKTAIAACIADMEAIKAAGKYNIEAQVRAYDLLSSLLEDADDGILTVDRDCAAAYSATYGHYAAILSESFDESALKNEAAKMLEPLEKACSDARFRAAAAASLHEFAKETFQTWQTAGIFARRRALKALRERAGFRLEQHRIGNYVAKTFDLMNQADADFAKAQQALFSANVSYKIQPGLYGKIAAVLAVEQ